MCSTCLESNYICQGYGETTAPSAPSRPQSAAASRSPAHPSALSNSNNDDSTNQSASAPSSYRSPDSQPPTTAPPSNFDRLPEAMQSQNVQGDHLAMNTGASYGTRNMPFNADKESGQQAAADSPDSSKSKNSLSIRSIRMPTDISKIRCLPIPFSRTDRSILNVNDHANVPYFRYFGPTAIVPGFKQMV